VDQVEFCTEREVHALMRREQESDWYRPTIKGILPEKEAQGSLGLFPF
jgi:hypothetical protein